MPPIVLASDCKDGQFDGVVVVAHSVEHLPAALQPVQHMLKKYLEVSSFYYLLFIVVFCLLLSHRSRYQTG